MSNLTLYLLKEGCTPNSALVKNNGLSKVQTNDLDTEIYIKKPFGKRPDWTKFFDSQYQEIERLNNSNSGCLLFVKCSYNEVDYWVALTFGHVAHLVEDKFIDHDFGIVTALNLIDPESLKTLEISRVEDGTLQEKKSQSKISNIDDFEIDVDRILLNAISGKSRFQDIAKSVIGKEGVKLSTKTKIGGAKEYCCKLLELYKKETFKTDYPWFGKINVVKDSLVSDKLWSSFCLTLQASSNNTYLAPPDILDDWNIDGFKFSGLGHNTTCEDLEIETLRIKLTEKFPESFSHDDLQKINVIALDLNESTVKTWPLTKCLVFETVDSGKQYILSRGKWFDVQPNFKQEVENTFTDIPRTEVSLPKFSRSKDRENKKYKNKNKEDSEKMVLSEGAYNKRVCQELSCIELDKITPNVAGKSSGVELCDFMLAETDKNKLFHIKCQLDGYKSQTLSSLFMQGYVSATVLKSSEEYREKIRKLVPQTKDFIPQQGIDPKKYEYCFGIVSNSPEHLPFFSKISLNKTAQNLKNMDYPVSICWIGIEE